MFVKNSGSATVYFPTLDPPIFINSGEVAELPDGTFLSNGLKEVAQPKATKTKTAPKTQASPSAPNAEAVAKAEQELKQAEAGLQAAEKA